MEKHKSIYGLRIITLAMTFVTLMLLAACTDDLFGDGSRHGTDRIMLEGEINQLSLTRVNDNGFCNNDVMGVYIVDYEGVNPGMLKPSGNHADNVRFTFDEANGKWISDYDIYWKDNHTNIDVYGYYPYSKPESIENYEFEVKRDQSKVSADGEMGGYEASDFLWGKVPDVAPTRNAIRLPLSHNMANARVVLQKGTGFTDGEWTQTEMKVLAANLIRKASINLSTGSVKPAGEVETTMTVPARVNNEWRAIVVPQTVAAGATLFSITIGGVPYRFSKNEEFSYAQGKMSNFTIRVDKKEDDGGGYKLTLVGESITPWENDLVSHDATGKEYVVINCPAVGQLAENIRNSGYDCAKIKYMKVTGRIGDSDFYFMRYEMPLLAGVNLKEVIPVDIYGENGVIPSGAFASKKSLVSVVFPDSLKRISGSAFYDTGLVGSLYLPEGLEKIEDYAFSECNGLNGSLYLPSTLKELGLYAFRGCKFNCNIAMPDGMTYIGEGAFYENSNLTGDLHLPSHLESLGPQAFFSSGSFGNLVVPAGLRHIPDRAFCSCSFSGNLELSDGIETISNYAFYCCGFKGSLYLPKTLVSIGDEAFRINGFSGDLLLPDNLMSIGNSAFSEGTKLSGTLSLPKNMTTVNPYAFCACGFEKLYLHENIELLGNNAFYGCNNLKSIVCDALEPPAIRGNAFDNVCIDNITLEVPEASVSQYKTAVGWNNFKHIVARYGMECSPRRVESLNKERKLAVQLYAKGGWQVASKPTWCDVSPESGNGSTKLTITMRQLSTVASTRTGNVEFRLNGKTDTYKMPVAQYYYQYGEDEWITLQKATKGKGVNLVFVGEGYGAQDIVSGDYLNIMQSEMENFFSLEPFSSCRQYFNVYTAPAVSQDTGVGTVNSPRNNKFATCAVAGGGFTANYDDIFEYVMGAPTVNAANLHQTLIVIVPNIKEQAGSTQLWRDGSAISFCPLSDDAYPYDSRGIIQHEAGGHGFGKLADENVCINSFVDTETVNYIKQAKSYGWFNNISLTGKTTEVPWSKFISNVKYSDIVDMYDGSLSYSLGIFRSEQNSCMNNFVPYFNTISRMEIMKRIKQYAGESFTLSDFIDSDKLDATGVTRRAALQHGGSNGSRMQVRPTLHSGSWKHKPAARKRR